MRRRALLGLACATIALAGWDGRVARATLYAENFDVNHAANWRVNDNGAGTNAANLFFDYSTVGIPPAPNSAGTTRGLKLGANLSSATAPASGPVPGISASPLGQNFSGNYEVKFDWWSNYFGPLGASPATATQASTFGILSSGTAPNYIGLTQAESAASDGLFFAATGNGGVPNAGATNLGDYSVYSVARPAGYQIPTDGQAFYLATSRDNTAPGYATVFPGGDAAPATQQAAFPATQTGVTPTGTAAFRWHQVEIEKIGDDVVWRVDGFVQIFVDTTHLGNSIGGGNILFGHSDTDRAASTNADFSTLQFTLIDNVRVLSLAGDYNQNGNVDAADYLVWKQQYGATGANAADGNGDGIVDAVDYTVWRNSAPPGSLGGDVLSLAVPEPTLFVQAATSLAAVSMCWRRRSR
jgi:hypothetical protein